MTQPNRTESWAEASAQPHPPEHRPGGLAPVILSGLAWLAGVAFLAAMVVLRFRADQP